MEIVLKAPRPAPMRTAAELVRELYDAWNRRDWGAVGALLDPGVEWFHTARHELVRGPAGVVEMMRSSADAFPNARIELRALRQAEGAIVAEWTVVNARASTTNDFVKPAIVCEVLELDGGRIVRASTYGDMLTMLMEFRDDHRPPLRAVC